eukprot:4437402-Ditylum_brightwellii.AAC.1
MRGFFGFLPCDGVVHCQCECASHRGSKAPRPGRTVGQDPAKDSNPQVRAILVHNTQPRDAKNDQEYSMAPCPAPSISPPEGRGESNSYLSSPSGGTPCLRPN